MWCRDLTECLTSEGDVLEAVEGAEQRCFQVGRGYFIVGLYVIISQRIMRVISLREISFSFAMFNFQILKHKYTELAHGLQ